MLQELTITKVYKSDKDKQGNPLQTKGGKLYTRVAIRVDYVDYDNQWLSHGAFRPEDPALQLKEGDRVKLKIERNGQYLNFDVPSRTDLLEERVYRLEKWVEQMNGKGNSPKTDVLEREEAKDEPPF